MKVKKLVMVEWLDPTSYVRESDNWTDELLSVKPETLLTRTFTMGYLHEPDKSDKALIVHHEFNGGDRHLTVINKGCVESIKYFKLVDKKRGENE